MGLKDEGCGLSSSESGQDVCFILKWSELTLDAVRGGFLS
jgi:hypothetical protein